MTTTPRGAPELAAAQAVPETTVNEQVRHTEAGACHFPVADRITTPPGTCSDGANYIITATATGAWTGKETLIATAVGTNAASGWLYHTPVEGFTAYVQDEGARYLFDGSAWGIDTGTPPTSGTRIINLALTGTALTSSEVMAALTPPSGETWTFAANFAGASGLKLNGGVNPAASYAIDVKKGASSVGTITISNTGVVSFATAGGTSFSLIGGTDGLQFIGDAVADTAVGYAFAIPVTY